MITLVKFIRNPREDSSPNNMFITRTLGKTGVLSWDHIDDASSTPRAEEFWYVRIVKEVGAGTARGVFLLEPIGRVTSGGTGGNKLSHIIPGTYKTKTVGNTMLLHPKILHYPESLGPHWICSLTMKKKLMSELHNGEYVINSVIVVFDGEHDWPKEGYPVKDHASLEEQAQHYITEH